MSSSPVVAMELMGNEAVSVWRKLLGPTDAAVAQKEAPQSVRARLGTDGVKNVGHGSDSLAAAAKVGGWGRSAVRLWPRLATFRHANTP